MKLIVAIASLLAAAPRAVAQAAAPIRARVPAPAPAADALPLGPGPLAGGGIAVSRVVRAVVPKRT